jgi:TonB family protein
MFEPALGRISEKSRSGQSSLAERIAENLKAVWNMRQAAFSGAPDAAVPFHLLRFDARGRTGQLGSTGMHLLLCTAIALIAFHPKKPPTQPFAPGQKFPELTFAEPQWLKTALNPSLGHEGGGGDRNPLPPTAGQLAPHARFEFMTPRLPDEKQHPLAMPVTILDPQAPDFVSEPKELGLPWLKQMTNSAGPGTNGVGRRGNGGMGDKDGYGAGKGTDARPYANAATPVICQYCPDPTYTEEARKTKLQGAVTLRVLVGEDGRAHEIQITKGLGLGLDEHAEEAVRTWQFVPAMDASHHAIASWVMIETTFRLF